MPPVDKSRNRIVLYGLTDSDSAEAEKDLISLLGRKDIGTGCLRNLTDGGEGVCNLTPAARQAISASMKSRPRGGAVKGSVRTEATKQRIGQAHKERIALMRERQGITDEDLAAAKRQYHREYGRRQAALSHGFETYEEYMQAKQAVKDARAAAKSQRQKPQPKSKEELVAERKAYNRAYYLRNRDEELARATAYRQANPLSHEQREQRNQYSREYRLANLERLRAYDVYRHSQRSAA